MRCLSVHLEQNINYSISSDSKKIAAAYHYGHEGNYTWVGIWDIETGNRVDTKRKSGWTHDIYWVFSQESR